MVAAFARRRKKSTAQTRVPVHPNDVDRKRIEKALARRARYHYVTPRVRASESGYRIVSPCCSRNIDKNGGEIDIALIGFTPQGSGWSLFSRDHGGQVWVACGEFSTLASLLELLVTDSERRFWQ